jgi:D-sedoheptulose 7-phosphate isomerase
MTSRPNAYFADLAYLITTSSVSRGQDALTFDAGVEEAVDIVHAVKAEGTRVMFIGNGGSAGIASHMAIDFTKNGGIPALAFNDGAYLTCIGNDLGFENVFAKPIEMHARPGDLVFAISSSGRSKNILNGVEKGRERGCRIIGFSGFKPDNPLRSLGDLNFYVPSLEYGYVEVAHQAILHCILDLAMGLKPGSAAATVAALQGE